MKEIRKTGKIKGVLLLCFLAFLAVSFIAPASATILASQTDYSASEYVAGAYPSYRGQSFTGVSGDLKSFQVAISGYGFGTMDSADLYLGSTQKGHYCWTGAEGNLQTFRLIEEWGSCVISPFATTGYPLDSGLTYHLILLWPDAKTYYGSADHDSFLDGEVVGPPYPWQHVGTLGDLYFKLSDQDGVAPTDEINFLRPMPDQTLADFSDWQVEFLLPVKWEGYYHLVLSYAPVGLFPYYSDESWTSGGAIDLFQFPKTNLLTNGNWQAKIGVWVGEEKIVESELIYFTIFNEYGGGVEPPPEPPIITCGETDFVCQLTKWLTDSFNKLISYLFIPSGASMNKFSTLWAPVEKKPPIGYFVLIRERLAELGEGTAGFTLAGTSGLTAVLSPLKTGIAFCLWLLFAFWLFKRISHLEL